MFLETFMEVDSFMHIHINFTKLPILKLDHFHRLENRMLIQYLDSIIQFIPWDDNKCLIV